MNQILSVIGVFALIVLAVMATIIGVGVIKGFILRRKMKAMAQKEQILMKGEKEDGKRPD